MSPQRKNIRFPSRVPGSTISPLRINRNRRSPTSRNALRKFAAAVDAEEDLVDEYHDEVEPEAPRAKDTHAEQMQHSSQPEPSAGVSKAGESASSSTIKNAVAAPDSLNELKQLIFKQAAIFKSLCWTERPLRDIVIARKPINSFGQLKSTTSPAEGPFYAVLAEGLPSGGFSLDSFKPKDMVVIASGYCGNTEKEALEGLLRAVQEKVHMAFSQPA